MKGKPAANHKCLQKVYNPANRMLHLLKRHPFAVRAHFDRSLVLTYAFPEALLRPLLPPGLVLDTYAGQGFLAIALVQTRRLRPNFLPAFLGRDFFLSGYRIFSRLGNESSALRGLYILRSDTDRRLMAIAGNWFTHYSYRLCQTTCRCANNELSWQIATPESEADLHVTAYLDSRPAPLPDGSPFENLKMARRFAGPLPYTFTFEPQTRSIVIVKGNRKQWDPQPVHVLLHQPPTYLSREPFCNSPARLANAFYLQDVQYSWDRGRRVPLTEIK